MPGLVSWRGPALPGRPPSLLPFRPRRCCGSRGLISMRNPASSASQLGHTVTVAGGALP